MMKYFKLATLVSLLFVSSMAMAHWTLTVKNNTGEDIKIHEVIQNGVYHASDLYDHYVGKTIPNGASSRFDVHWKTCFGIECLGKITVCIKGKKKVCNVATYNPTVKTVSFGPGDL